MSVLADRVHRIEQSATLLADCAVGAAIDFFDWIHLCEKAYDEAIESRARADAEDRAARRIASKPSDRWRVLVGGKDG